jgi:hypothetical protein
MKRTYIYQSLVNRVIIRREANGIAEANETLASTVKCPWNYTVIATVEKGTKQRSR